MNRQNMSKLRRRRRYLPLVCEVECVGGAEDSLRTETPQLEDHGGRLHNTQRAEVGEAALVDDVGLLVVQLHDRPAAVVNRSLARFTKGLNILKKDSKK